MKIFTDGAARGNPGPAGIGAVLNDENGCLLESHYEFIGCATNNVAEYKALLKALHSAKKYIPCSLELFLDSELVVKQINGKYSVKNAALKLFHNQAMQFLLTFDSYKISHIPREQNKLADKLANKAIDQNNI